MRRVGSGRNGQRSSGPLLGRLRMSLPQLDLSAAPWNRVEVPLARAWCRCRLKFSRLVCSGTAADEDGVIGRLDNAAVIDIEERQFIKTEREIDRFGFAWIERQPCEPFQTADRLFDARAPNANVTLHDLGPATVAGVSHPCGGVYRMCIAIVC